MKYLKKFEKKFEPLKYNDGDYVVLDIEKFTKNNKIDNKIDELPNKFGIITNREYYDDLPYPYIVKTYTPGEDDEGLFIKFDEIERLMTPEEIEFFNMKLKANKFNI